MTVRNLTGKGAGLLKTYKQPQPLLSLCCNALVISNGSYCVCSHCFQVIPTILKNSGLSEEQASDYAKNELRIEDIANLSQKQDVFLYRALILEESKAWIYSCDFCAHQDSGGHYCLLHSRVLEDMDITRCADWTWGLYQKL